MEHSYPFRLAIRRDSRHQIGSPNRLSSRKNGAFCRFDRKIGYSSNCNRIFDCFLAINSSAFEFTSQASLRTAIWTLSLSIASERWIWTLHLNIAFGHCIWTLLLNVASERCFWTLLWNFAFRYCIWTLHIEVNHAKVPIPIPSKRKFGKSFCSQIYKQPHSLIANKRCEISTNSSRFKPIHVTRFVAIADKKRCSLRHLFE